MAAEGDNNFIRYIYRGEEGEHNIIPREATHITVDKDVTVVRAFAFQGHPNIVEVICHEKVERIEQYAFNNCPSLRRVVMPGVKIVEFMAFHSSAALTEIECGRLEIIKGYAFVNCESLRSINLSSIRILEMCAFNECLTLVEAKFSNKLESLGWSAFNNCESLERITIPLKDGIITDDDIFAGCKQLKHVDLVEGELHETISALPLEEWKTDMNNEIDSINRILPDTYPGYWDEDERDGNPGEKARAIRRWIRSVLGKIIHYQAEHQHVLNVAATTLQLVLPHDIVNRSVLPFLELPSHTFELAEGGDEDEDEASYSEDSSSGGESEMDEVVNDDDEASFKRRRIAIEQ